MGLLPPARLRCAWLREPAVIDEPGPRLSWHLEDPRPGARQTACRVMVAAGGREVWDSGRVAREEPWLPYGGPPLAGARRYTWHVRWWDGEGGESPFSAPAAFATGLVEPGRWQGSWITMAGPEAFASRGTFLLGKNQGEYVQALGIYLRREFTLPAPVLRATVFSCGLGWHEVRLNGRLLGDQALDPAPTDYRQAALYSAHDATGLLARENALAAVLGNGRHLERFGYPFPRLRLQLEAELEGGGAFVLATDGTWLAAHGPLRENGIYFGEVYDARLEEPGWDLPGFAGRGWREAAVVGGPPLAAQMIPPVRVLELIPPERITSPSPGVFILDFGRNLAGRVRLRARGPAGTRIRLRHAELLHPDGTLNPAPNENAEAEDALVLAGRGAESWEPSFTYHGFRYAEIKGLPGAPGPETALACSLHTDVEPTGTFHCGDDLVNRIHANARRSLLANLVGIPTDCPQRDERHGWLGDAHLAAEAGLLNLDLAAFLRKFLADIRRAQDPDGSLPDLVPPYWEGLRPADPAWGSAYPTLAWLVYFHYADLDTLEEHREGLVRYLGFLRSRCRDGLPADLGKYGDWCPPGSIRPLKTPVGLVAAWFFVHDLMTMGRIDDALGRGEDARRWRDEAAAAAAAFNAAFLGPEGYASPPAGAPGAEPSQTAQVLPLHLGIVPPEAVERVLGGLLRSVERLHDGHLDTGIIGTRYLLETLTAHGRADLAWRIVTRTTYPGWGYMIAQGATTLWERWEGLAGGGMNSQNHAMLGSVDSWLYQAVAGLAPAAAGWRRLLLRPHLVPGLDHARATHLTPFGPAEISWRREAGGLELCAQVPVGTTAELHLPLPPGEPRATLDGRPLWPRPGAAATPSIRVLGREGDRLRLELPAGLFVLGTAGTGAGGG